MLILKKVYSCNLFLKQPVYLNLRSGKPQEKKVHLHFYRIYPVLTKPLYFHSMYCVFVIILPVIESVFFLYILV